LFLGQACTAAASALVKDALHLKGIQLLQVEEASYKKYGGFEGVQEARRQQLDLQAATRMKRKAVEAKKVMLIRTIKTLSVLRHAHRIMCCCLFRAMLPVNSQSS